MAVRVTPAPASTVHTNSGMRNHVIPRARMLWIVTMKLIAPRIDEIEVRWMARIQRSWPLPGSKACSESGGYEYQPARAAPPAENQLA